MVKQQNGDGFPHSLLLFVFSSSSSTSSTKGPIVSFKLSLNLCSGPGRTIGTLAKNCKEMHNSSNCSHDDDDDDNNDDDDDDDDTGVSE